MGSRCCKRSKAVCGVGASMAETAWTTSTASGSERSSWSGGGGKTESVEGQHQSKQQSRPPRRQLWEKRKERVCVRAYVEKVKNGCGEELAGRVERGGRQTSLDVGRDPKARHRSRRHRALGGGGGHLNCQCKMLLLHFSGGRARE